MATNPVWDTVGLLNDNLSKTHTMLFYFLYSGTESSILYIVRSLVSLASSTYIYNSTA